MSDDYVQCKYCEYLDKNETNGYKCYCEWYKTYEDPDKVQECKHFRER